MKVSAMQIAADRCRAQTASAHPHPAARSRWLKCTTMNAALICSGCGFHSREPLRVEVWISASLEMQTPRCFGFLSPSNNMHIKRTVTLPFGSGLPGQAAAALPPAVQDKRWLKTAGWTVKLGNFKGIRRRWLSWAAFAMNQESKSKIIHMESHWGRMLDDRLSVYLQQKGRFYTVSEAETVTHRCVSSGKGLTRTGGWDFFPPVRLWGREIIKSISFNLCIRMSQNSNATALKWHEESF